MFIVVAEFTTISPLVYIYEDRKTALAEAYHLSQRKSTFNPEELSYKAVTVYEGEGCSALTWEITE